jgi:hypothetical protein
MDTRCDVSPRRPRRAVPTSGWRLSKRHEFPIDFSVNDFKPGNAWPRAAVRARHAARVEKQNPPASFVARNVRVPVQENIDILWRSIRRNVLESEFQPTSRKVKNQPPLEIAVAISAHNRDGRSNRAQLVKNRFRANIAKMPNFVGIPGHFAHAFRQTIVRVGKNKDA